MERKGFDPLLIIKEILLGVLTLAGVFAWLMLVQLIVSFIGMSYIRMKFKTMVIVAAALTAVFAVCYVIRRVMKNRKGILK